MRTLCYRAVAYPSRPTFHHQRSSEADRHESSDGNGVTQLDPATKLADVCRDCITVERLPDQRFVLECSALIADTKADTYYSVAVVGGEPYSNYADAEAAGLAWADERGVAQRYVSCVDQTLVRTR